MAQLKVQQKKSTIGCKANQRETLRSLGLKRIGDVVVKEDRPEIRGMVHTVRHLVTVVRRSTDMTLKLHHLRPAPGAKTAKTRVGRGEGSKGKTAGRGTKGTKARNQVPASFEGGQMPLHMRLPKLKGFKNPFQGGVPGRQPRPDRRAVPRGWRRHRRGPGRPRAPSARASR